MTPRFSVVIVNYNAGGEIVPCIESVFAQGIDDVEVVVVDNASSDGSLQAVRDAYGDRVTVVENETNRGFAPAFNQGVDATAGEYVMALNFDVRLREGFLATLMTALDGDETAGMASGKLLRENGAVDSAGIGMKRLFPFDRGDGEPDDGRFSTRESVFGPSGAAAVYRRAMLADVAVAGEVFDEDFFMVAEDVDLAWRAQSAGWRCLFVPEAAAVHERGVTRRGSTAAHRRYDTLGYRNRYLCVIKNLTASTLRRHFGRIAVSEVRGFFRTIKHHGAAVALGAVFGALRLLPRMLAKRRAILAASRVDPREIEPLLGL